MLFYLVLPLFIHYTIIAKFRRRILPYKNAKSNEKKFSA